MAAFQAPNKLSNSDNSYGDSSSNCSFIELLNSSIKHQEHFQKSILNLSQQSNMNISNSTSSKNLTIDEMVDSLVNRKTTSDFNSLSEQSKQDDLIQESDTATIKKKKKKCKLSNSIQEQDENISTEVLTSDNSIPQNSDLKRKKKKHKKQKYESEKKKRKHKDVNNTLNEIMCEKAKDIQEVIEIDENETNTSEFTTKKKKKKRKDKNEDLNIQSEMLNSKEDYKPKKKKQKKQEDEKDQTTDEVNDIISAEEIKKHVKKLKKKKSNDEEDKKARVSFSDAVEQYEIPNLKTSSLETPQTSIISTEELSSDSAPQLKKKKHVKRKLDISDVYSTSASENEDTVNGKSCLPLKLSDLNISDPTDIDEITDAIDIALDNKRLSSENVQVLKDLTVLIPWEVAQSHMIETRMSCLPTKTQRLQFKALNIKLNIRPFTKREDGIIKTNWLKFCKSHHLHSDPTPFLTFQVDNSTILDKSQRINFVRYLGKGLEDRMLYSIYRRFQLLFKTYAKGKYTPAEDSIILTYMKSSRSVNKYSDLAKLLNRTRSSVTRRYINLTSENTKINWTLSLLEKLLETIMVVTGKETVQELKNFPLTTQHWQEIEEKINLPYEKLKFKWNWYLFPKLFYEEFENLNEIRRKLINKLCDLSEFDRRIIDWPKLAADFDGLTGARLNKIFVDMLNAHVPKYMRKDFKASINYLKNEYLSNKSNGKRISKLYYVNGKLVKSPPEDDSVTSK